MADTLIHIRIGKKVKRSMQELIEEGLFTNQTEIAREAIRDLLLKYNKLGEHKKEGEYKKETNVKSDMRNGRQKNK